MAVALGTTSVLVAGTGTFTLKSNAQFWFIQNQDTSPLKVTFLGAAGGYFSSIVLSPAPSQGGAGGYLDSLGFPYFEPIGFILTSAVAAAQFGSGQSPVLPVNNYAYPGVAAK